MPSIILNNISEPRNLSDENLSRPQSFLEWNSRHVGISFSDAEVQYSQYLASFYNKNEKKNIEAANKLKNDYIALIERLQVIFENDEDFERYKNIDVTSETDLALAIPAYAKKLKEIALFYAKKREEVKNKKLEYNLVGSYHGLSKLLYTNLVSKFTKNDHTQFVNENPLITESPEFSAIFNDFKIEVEELYDTTDYFDEQTETLNPFACIFNNLCYNILTTPVSAYADPLEYNYICDPSNETVDSLLQQAYQKYLSTEISFISGGYYIENLKSFTIPFEQGNNFMYWFSGSTVFDIPEGLYKDLPINNIEWTEAVGGSAYDVSDLIFVNAGNILTQGAWLQDTTYITVTATMSATMTDGKIFKFPYPDYGSSAVGGDWSGPGLNDTVVKSRKFFPTEEDFTSTENSINQLYWNSFSSISTVNDIYLQETNIGHGGYASKRYSSADKVYVRTESENKQVYSGDMRVAWLYDFRQTQLPITQGENKLYFPLQRYEEDSELLFNYKNGQPVALSSISVPDAFAGAVGATSLPLADMIIKNQTICGPQIEAAWLKSVTMEYYTNFDKGRCDCDPGQVNYYTGWQYISGGIQQSISFKADSNQYVRFVWSGETTDINDVRGFTGFEHDDSCPYKRLDHSISIVDTNFLNATNGAIFEKWKRCSCRAVNYSPFGHNETALEAFRITPDFIVKDTKYPTLFNKKTWLGSDGLDYRSSVDSARFYPQLIEKDVGWGKGEWESQTGTPFMLEKGMSYIYYRSDTNNCTFDSPYFVINEGYGDGTVSDDNCARVPYRPIWMKAVQDENGVWVDAGVVTDMTLSFGDFLIYDHKASHKETRRRFLYDGVEVTSTSGDFVTFYGPDEKISFAAFTNEIPSVNFLIKIPISATNNFWGKGTYGEDVGSIKQTAVETDEFDIVFDYLQLTQPDPSDILLSDKDIIEYRFGTCNDSCFIWIQDLTFTVYNPIRKWNQFLFDTCVSSEILTYLNRESTNCYIKETRCISDCDSFTNCGCEHFCNPTKSGVTATFIDSDIIFNTELSGLPLFINYYARDQFNQDVTVHDVTDGEQSVLVPIVSGDQVKPEAPWRNLLSQDGSNFVIEEHTRNLKTVEDINFYNPKRMGMGRYETFDSRTSFTPNTTGFTTYRKDNYFDKPFGKLKYDSEYITDFSLGKRQGDILSKKKQTFIPYTNTAEQYDKDFYGLYELPLSFTPWNMETGEWKESDQYKNFRNQYNVNCENDWFTDQLVLTGDVSDWQTDVFGNQYFVTHDSDLNFVVAPSSYGTVYVKLQNGTIHPLADALSSIVGLYENIQITISDPFSGI